jgi:hypothetical protein
MTPLAKKMVAGNGAPAPTVKSQLAVVLERGPRGELVELPVLGPVWLQLIGHDDVQAIEAEVMKRMAAHGLEPVALNALSYDAERAVLTLARAVRSPDDRVTAFGTEAEWAKVDSDTIASCWHIFGDLRERLSPLDVEIPPAMRTEILAAIAKKLDAVEVVRAHRACELADFYGVPARDLTITEVVRWGVLAGDLVTEQQAPAKGPAHPQRGLQGAHQAVSETDRAEIEISASTSKLAAGLARARSMLGAFASNVSRGIGGAMGRLNKHLELGKTGKHVLGEVGGNIATRGLDSIVGAAEGVRDFERNLMRFQITTNGSAASTATLRNQIRQVSKGNRDRRRQCSPARRSTSRSPVTRPAHRPRCHRSRASLKPRRLGIGRRHWQPPPLKTSMVSTRTTSKRCSAG